MHFTSVILFLAASMAVGEAPAPTPQKVTVLVTYHSGGGHTAALAQAVAEGARSVDGTLVTLKPVSQVTCQELTATQGLIVGSPVYWSNMSGEVKSFFDRWTTECKFLPPDFPMKDKVGGAFVTGGEVSSGTEITLMTIVAALLGNRRIVVSDGQALGATATTGEGGLPLVNGVASADFDNSVTINASLAQTVFEVRQARVSRAGQHQSGR